MNEPVSTVRVSARYEPQPSQWLWLVKWILAIPHYLILVVLWLCFAVTALVAFVTILFTGTYPRSIFDFNLGVMRWTWRVSFYSYGAIGTDLYPPFTLADVPDYPARLDIDYPESFPRGFALVGHWLKGFPHYVIVWILVGSFGVGPVSSLGLVGVLVVTAGVVLLFTSTYPRPIFDLVIGFDRWVTRVIAYASLMTSEYPPFRVDPGENNAPAIDPTNTLQETSS